MPDWNKIAEKQQKAYESMYDPMEIADGRRRMEERDFKARVKNFMLEILKEDKQFREEVKRLLKK